jgi:hypothetical protein
VRRGGGVGSRPRPAVSPKISPASSVPRLIALSLHCRRTDSGKILKNRIARHSQSRRTAITLAAAHHPEGLFECGVCHRRHGNRQKARPMEYFCSPHQADLLPYTLPQAKGGWLSRPARVMAVACMAHFRGHIVFADAACPDAAPASPASPPAHTSQVVSAKLTNAGETARTYLRTEVDRAVHRTAGGRAVRCTPTLQRAAHLLCRDGLGGLPGRGASVFSSGPKHASALEGAHW